MQNRIPPKVIKNTSANVENKEIQHNLECEHVGRHTRKAPCLSRFPASACNDSGKRHEPRGFFILLVIQNHSASQNEYRRYGKKYPAHIPENRLSAAPSFFTCVKMYYAWDKLSNRSGLYIHNDPVLKPLVGDDRQYSHDYLKHFNLP